MAEDGKIVLNSFCFSSCSWRVRLALEYKEIPFDLRTWNLSKGEHLGEEYTKINPFQSVPALEIDGAVLTDSIAILEYLEERFPDKNPLLPKDLKKRAAIRSVVNGVASSTQPLQNLGVLNAVVEKLGEEARVEWAQKWIMKGFNSLEAIVEKTAGRFCFGDDFTLADVVLLPQVRNAHRFKVDMEKYPTLQRVSKNISETEAAVKSKPENQPDYTGPRA